MIIMFFFFFSSRRRHTRFDCDWSSDVCSSDLGDQYLRPAERQVERPDEQSEADDGDRRGHDRRPGGADLVSAPGALREWNRPDDPAEQAEDRPAGEPQRA